MRVVPIHPAGDPVQWDKASLRIGSAPDDGIVVKGVGVAPHHVLIVADARGLAMTVTKGCQRVYVNARAVRERALLRYGDTLTLGTCKYLITADTPPPVPGAASGSGEVPGRVALRIVSGQASGRALDVASALQLGAGSRHFGDVACACHITRSGDGLALESENGVPRVNGWSCRRARLTTGDQVVVGGHHLVVEAPALQYAAWVAAWPAPARLETPVPIARHTRGEVGWLIAVAVLLAIVIALVLYFHG